MFGFSIKLSFRRIVAAALVMAIALAAVIFLGEKKGNEVVAFGETERLEYIRSLGYDPISSIAEEKEVVIPAEFSSVYDNYNRLQKQAGFDLEPYKGCSVMRYTYSLGDFPADEYVVINLLVTEEKIIGGDISSRRLDGFMLPLLAKQNG